MKENENENDCSRQSIGDCAELINGKLKLIQDRYNEHSLERIKDENPMDIVDDQSTFNMDIASITEDIERVKKTYHALNVYLEELKGMIHEVKNPDTTQYENWNIGTIIIWMSGLENGRYRKYLEQIKNGLEASEIVKGEYLLDIDKTDLLAQPFGISSLPDRTVLMRHFKALKAGVMNNARKVLL